MIVKLQDGVELGEGWKRISVKSIIPVTGNEVNIGKENLYPTTGGNVRNRTGEPAAEMTDTSRGGIFPDIPYCITEGQCHLSKDLSKTDQEQVQPVLVEHLWSGLLLAAPETERNGISPRYGNLCLAAWSHRRWGSTSQSLNLTISCRSQRGRKVSESPYSFTGLSSVTQNYLLNML